MAVVLPRRQAARLAEAFGKHFAAGLTCVEAPPRRGKTDLLLQLHAALVQQRAVAPVLLRLGNGGLPYDAAEQAAAQIAAFLDGSLRSPRAVLDQAQLAERDDFAAWQEFLTHGKTPGARRFFEALARLAENVGPVCLLLDDSDEETLRSAAQIEASEVAVVAAGSAEKAGCVAQAVPLEEFSVREGLLLAEGLARHFEVKFRGSAAEPFVAYAGSDPFVLQAVARNAAATGGMLDSREAFVRAYVNELRTGTLAAYFRAHLPLNPGSLEWRFAIEFLAAGGLEKTRLSRWRARLPIDDVLRRLHAAGLVVAGQQGWGARRWPAARDWALLQLPAADSADRETGRLTIRLLCEMEAAAREQTADQVCRRVVSGLGGVVTAAGGAESGAQLAEICHIAREKLGDAELFLCYGFTEARHTAESAGMLPVAVVAENGRLSRVLADMDARVAAALPGRATGSPIEKWVVVKNAAPADAELVEGAGARLIDFETFNRMLGDLRTPSAGAAEAEGPPRREDVVLQLPVETDFEIPAVRVLDYLLHRNNCDERTASQARMALVEACLNAFEHARGTGSVEVRLRVAPGALEMIVTNAGAPFEPGAGDLVDGAGLHRGHGLKIIRSVMDEVTFASDLKGTSIQMFKTFPVRGAGITAEPVEDEKTALGM